jgi:hypothetical protein
MSNYISLKQGTYIFTSHEGFALDDIGELAHEATGFNNPNGVSNLFPR